MSILITNGGYSTWEYYGSATSGISGNNKHSFNTIEACYGCTITEKGQ